MYAYTAARLASGKISFEQVGKLLPPKVVSLSYQKAAIEGKTIKGNLSILDVQYGNLWTNISDTLFKKLDVKLGDQLHLAIFHEGKKVYEGNVPYHETFGAVAKGQPLAYLNSLMNLSFALNQDSFAAVYHIGSGNEWSVEIEKL